MVNLASSAPASGALDAPSGVAISVPNPLTTGSLRLRPAHPEDAASCARICFEAFYDISTRHAFPPDFRAVDDAVALFDFMLAQPDVHVVVAEVEGRIVGSNALWEQSPIAGVGPITVEPGFQDGAVGRELMRHVIERADARKQKGIRLCQAAYHGRSLALYTKLGFDAREPLSVFQGPPILQPLSGLAARNAGTDDIEACARLHERLHGYSRAGELPAAIAQGGAMVVVRDGRITGYTTQVGFFGHTVGETMAEVAALIAAATAFPGPGFLVPTRHAALMRWCLEHRLRIVQPMTLMSRGFYEVPSGAYLPSVLF